MADSSDEILDSELVMRRVPVNASWYDPSRGLMAEAFKPHKTDDKDGLSISRVRSETNPEFLTPAMLAKAGHAPACRLPQKQGDAHRLPTGSGMRVERLPVKIWMLEKPASQTTSTGRTTIRPRA